MSDGKKRRMSMLDSLASAGAAPPPTSMISSNRALRSARHAVDNHHVWDLDPELIDDRRVRDRLDHSNLVDLRDAIEANGQTVPILVRRNPAQPERYLLVYGRRRLEAIRTSDKVKTVRALVADLDDGAAVTAQVSENLGRQDLSFIEKALFAKELISSGFGNQSDVAEVLTVTKSSISMALSIVEAIGADLIQAIGPAQGVGRPRWETLAKALEGAPADRAELIGIADRVHDRAAVAVFEDDVPTGDDPSVLAFDAVMKSVGQPPAPPRKPAPKPSGTPLKAGGQAVGSYKRTARGLAFDLNDRAFADWFDENAPDIMTELHARYLDGSED